MKKTNYISTTHSLAKELLSKPDGFLTATYKNLEFIIDSYQKTFIHSNTDDNVSYWTLVLRDGGGGNIKR